MDHTKVKHLEKLYTGSNRHFATQYARKHHVPVRDVLDTMAAAERQNEMTRSLLALKNKS